MESTLLAGRTLSGLAAFTALGGRLAGLSALAAVGAGRGWWGPPVAKQPSSRWLPQPVAVTVGGSLPRLAERAYQPTESNFTSVEGSAKDYSSLHSSAQAAW
ncbi:hypothetical protein GCM10009570_21570 [Dietzia natronolimnaea]